MLDSSIYTPIFEKLDAESLLLFVIATPKRFHSYLVAESYANAKINVGRD